MSATIDRSGVACCGNCGSQLVIVCSGGCAEPDVVFRDDHIASLRKPRPEKKKSERAVQMRERKPTPNHCTYRTCTEPVAPREPGAMGRPTTRCAKHLEQFRLRRLKAEVAA